MSESAENNQHVLQAILRTPQGEALRNVAHLITDIVFDVRKNQVFSDVFEREGIDPSAKQTLRRLMGDFRAQAEALTGQDLHISDDELYREVVLPIVTRLIDESA